MDKLELVEIVREKAGVGYADAKDALDASNDDLLDALVWLERQGRSQTTSAYGSTGAPGAGRVSSEMRAAQSAYARASVSAPQAVANWVSGVFAAIGRFVRRGMDAKVVSGGEGSMRLPLLTTVIGEVLWLALLAQSLQSHYPVFGIFTVAAMVAPIAVFFFLVFACHIERAPQDDEDTANAAPTPAAAPRPAGEPVAGAPKPPEVETAPEAAPTAEPEAADGPETAPETESVAEPEAAALETEAAAEPEATAEPEAAAEPEVSSANGEPGDD